MGRLFTREALIETARFATFICGLQVLAFLIAGRWPVIHDAYIVVAIVWAWWLGRFGKGE